MGKDKKTVKNRGVTIISMVAIQEKHTERNPTVLDVKLVILWSKLSRAKLIRIQDKFKMINGNVIAIARNRRDRMLRVWIKGVSKYQITKRPGETAPAKKAIVNINSLPETCFKVSAMFFVSIIGLILVYPLTVTLSRHGLAATRLKLAILP